LPVVQVMADVQPAIAVQSEQTVSLLLVQAAAVYLPAGQVEQAWHAPPAR
jgi:hypothetical protein